jgi:hypothetical protein
MAKQQQRKRRAESDAASGSEAQRQRLVDQARSALARVAQASTPRLLHMFGGRWRNGNGDSQGNGDASGSALAPTVGAAAALDRLIEGLPAARGRKEKYKCGDEALAAARAQVLKVRSLEEALRQQVRQGGGAFNGPAAARWKAWLAALLAVDEAREPDAYKHIHLVAVAAHKLARATTADERAAADGGAVTAQDVQRVLLALGCSGSTPLAPGLAAWLVPPLARREQEAIARCAKRFVEQTVAGRCASALARTLGPVLASVGATALAIFLPVLPHLAVWREPRQQIETLAIATSGFVALVAVAALLGGLPALLSRAAGACDALDAANARYLALAAALAGYRSEVDALAAGNAVQRLASSSAGAATTAASASARRRRTYATRAMSKRVLRPRPRPAEATKDGRGKP